MKKIFALIILSGFFASCTDLDLEEQKIMVSELGGYVAFANAGGTVTPIALKITETTTATQNLRIECPTGSLSDITVTYAFSGTAVYNTDFTVVSPAGGTSTAAGGTIIIKRNTTTGGVNDFDFVNLGIKALTDAVADGTKTLTIALVSATNVEGKSFKVGRGIEGGTNYQVTASVEFANVPLSVQFAAASATTVENSKSKTALRIVPNFAIPTGSAVTATYSVSGAAVYGTDYTSKNPLTGTIVLPVGSTGVLIDSLSVIDDNLLEATAGEDAVVTITGVSIDNAANGNVVAIGATNKFTYKIMDENKKIETAPEATPLILNSLNHVGVRNFKVLLPNKSSETVTISYSITGGAAGVDYVDETAGTISFAAGQTSSNIELRMLESAFTGKGNSTPINITIKLNDSAVTTDGEVSVSTGVKSEFQLRIIPLN